MDWENMQRNEAAKTMRVKNRLSGSKAIQR